MYMVNWGWHDHKDPETWGPFIHFLTEFAKWLTLYVIVLWHLHHHCCHLCTVILSTSLIQVTSYVACIFTYFPINTFEVISTYTIFVTLEGHILLLVHILQ